MYWYETQIFWQKMTKETAFADFIFVQNFEFRTIGMVRRDLTCT